MGIHQQPKEFRDAYPAEAWKAVKLAIRQTVAKAGCLDAVAKQCRVSHKARVSEWQNPYSDDFPNLWQVGQLEGLAGVDWITEAMCALHNGDLVKRGSAEAQGAIIARLAVAAREMGEALSSSAEAVAKPGCRSTATTSVREVREAIRAAMELAAALEAQGAR